MSTIYKFQDSETALTVPMATTDSFPCYSTVAARTRQVTAQMAAMSAKSVTNLTSASTGTNILPYGITTIKTSNSALGYLLSAPTYAGFEVKIAVLSTGGPTVTSSNAVFVTNGSTALTVMTFNGVFGHANLVALSTASWMNVTSTTTANIAWS